MAKFLLAAWPFTGHINPNIALADALRRRGHQVAIYSDENVRLTVEAERFCFFGFKQVANHIYCFKSSGKKNQKPRNLSRSSSHKLTARYTPENHQGPLSRIHLLRKMYHEWLLGTVPAQVHDLSSIIADFHPDVLVSDPFLFGPSLILNDLRTLPIAVFSYFAACLIPGPQAPPPGMGLPRPYGIKGKIRTKTAQFLATIFSADNRRIANRLRRSYGLGPISGSVIGYAANMPLYLVSSVPELDYQRRDLASSVHYVGPCLWDKSNNEAPKKRLTSTDGNIPLVYVTEGTAHVQSSILLENALTAFQGLPIQVIMTTGYHRNPKNFDLKSTADNIHITQWISHSELFPVARVVVSQGGSGTILSALQHGLPQVIVPLWWDQMENARRIEDAGAGIMLPSKQCTARKLREAVCRVLDDPSIRANAMRLAMSLAENKGPDRAAKLLENLVHEK
jgi:MGT family glycosyltransferase